MSSVLTFSTGDLRSHAELYKRDAAQKHKWALGATETVTRTGRQPRPYRPTETEFNARRRKVKAALAEQQPSIKTARRYDILEGTKAGNEANNATLDYDDIPSPPADNTVTFSFSDTQKPSAGSQILNAALAKAVEQYEERETVSLIRSEYAVLDADGEVVTPDAFKRRKPHTPKLTPSDGNVIVEDDYEIV